MTGALERGRRDHGAACKRIASRSLTLVLLAAAASACDPVINVQGAFFPAWIVCILAGLALTGLAHRILVALEIQPYLAPQVLVYPSMVLLFTMAVWLLVYRS